MNEPHPAEYPNDTIAAISTSIGEGGIGIVRLSGPEAADIAASIFRRANGVLLPDPRPFRQYFGHIVHPESGEIIDEALLCVMRAPRSYTREDMAEISAHGGMIPLRAILDLACALGARPAEAGEFTRRAFVNGRIDLTQAEAVLDTIRARTDAGLRAAQARLRGKLGDHVRDMRGRLIDLLASLEAAIDFAEDDIVFLSPEEIGSELDDLSVELGSLADTFTRGRLLRDGASTAIIGRPNTGKSSLLNALLGENRAIVTAIPGTTRDIIEESCRIGDIPLRLIDTAGIRHTDDEVERLGVERSRASLEDADLILLVLDGGHPLTAEDKALLATIQGRPAIVLLNKSDLSQVIDGDNLGVEMPVLRISALTGEGLSELERRIADLLLGGCAMTESVALANQRQFDAVRRARLALDEARATHARRGSEELLAVDITAAAVSLGELTGDDIREEMVSEIFSRFCVGK